MHFIWLPSCMMLHFNPLMCSPRSSQLKEKVKAWSIFQEFSWSWYFSGWQKCMLSGLYFKLIVWGDEHVLCSSPKSSTWTTCTAMTKCKGHFKLCILWKEQTRVLGNKFNATLKMLWVRISTVLSVAPIKSQHDPGAIFFMPQCWRYVAAHSAANRRQ